MRPELRTPEQGPLVGVPGKATRATAVTPDVVKAHGLSPQEYGCLVEILGRTPTLVELGLASVMWSEHCCYKSSRRYLKRLPTEGPAILLGPGEQAGAVDWGDGLAVVFKVESHNHPSFVMPYHGAATGVGGILRDIFAMGARPVALANSLRFGPTSDGLCRDIFEGVVEGIAGYGNCVGVPTVTGEVFFDESFRRNPLVNVLAVGTARSDALLAARADGPGNPVYIFGGRTGRDGIHGATFASDVMAGDGGESKPSVQVGDPFLGKELLEASLELARAEWLVGLQDMGAAGLTCSSIEMSAKSRTGMVLDLERVPLRAEGMTPYEIMLSETQERMLVVVRKGAEAELEALFARYDLPCAPIGVVADTGRLTLRWYGEVVADIPVEPLADGAPVVVREAAPPAGWSDDGEAHASAACLNPEAALLALLGSENLRSRRFVFARFDHTVRGDTVLRPGDGDAAVLRLRGRTDGLAVTLDGNSRWCGLHPRRGAAATVAEAARNLACVGARPMAVTDGLNLADPTRPDVTWQLAEIVEGLREGCLAMETPVVGGNVSLYNETDEGRVLPTPVVGMVGRLADVHRARGQAFRRAGHRVALVGAIAADPSIAGSEYQVLHDGRATGVPPAVDLRAERALVDWLVRTADDGLLASAHDVSLGGLLVAVAECCLAGRDGLGVDVDGLPDVGAGTLFGEAGGRAVVSYDEANEPALRALADETNIEFMPMGRVVPGVLRVTGTLHLPLDQVFEAWQPRSGGTHLAWPADDTTSSTGFGGDR